MFGSTASASQSTGASAALIGDTTAPVSPSEDDDDLFESIIKDVLANTKDHQRRWEFYDNLGYLRLKFAHDVRRYLTELMWKSIDEKKQWQQTVDAQNKIIEELKKRAHAKADCTKSSKEPYQCYTRPDLVRQVSTPRGHHGLDDGAALTPDNLYDLLAKGSHPADHVAAVAEHHQRVYTTTKGVTAAASTCIHRTAWGLSSD
ncbi:hypothetical protein Pelo_5005 [Pelomyxa schiedti]|nr:hypothetical protein Pelo_5005 [Pelomyxa schiedti]